MTSRALTLDGTILRINGDAGADVAWSVQGLGNNAGQVSAQIDLGANAREYLFDWTCYLFMQATPTQYRSINIYAAGALDGFNTEIDGDVGVVDAALGSVDQLRNCLYLDAVVIEGASVTKMAGGGSFAWTRRYLSLIAFNNDTGASLSTAPADFMFRLMPRAIQGQDT